MKFLKFFGHCPYEVGDVVVSPAGEQTITDIAFIHYWKTKKVSCLYELDDSGQYVDLLTIKIEGMRLNNESE